MGNISFSLPEEITQSLNDLAKHRKVSVENLVRSVVTRYVQKHAPEPGRFTPDLGDDTEAAVRCANALMVQAIDNGRYAMDIPTVDGSQLSLNDENGNPILLHENWEYWVRRRYEAAATMKTGTMWIVHNGRNHTGHVVFSGSGAKEKMHLWIEEG